MKKRILSMFLAIVMLLAAIPMETFGTSDKPSQNIVENPFTDVKPTDWYYSSVQYAYANKFFSGVSETRFAPSDPMNRAMFVTVLGRMAGVNPDNYKYKSIFKDVADNTWYTPYVNWASKYNITQGVGDDLFAPDKNINREQMIVFFVRYLESFDVSYQAVDNITTKPVDMDSVSSYAKEAVLKLWQMGIVNGNGGNFKPQSKATRAEAATMCQRFDSCVDVWYSEPGVISEREKEDNNKPDETVTEDTDQSHMCTVSFYDGDRLIEQKEVPEGQPTGSVPDNSKTSKLNAVLLGFYTDKACTKPFYADDLITEDTNVYAKYQEMGSEEELNLTSFAQMDQSPDISFEIKRVYGDVSADKAAELTIKDGSDAVELSITEKNGRGIYTVKAKNGFNKGASYELTLADGWIFDGKVETIRIAAFSIKMEEVENLEMNDDIVYIKDTDYIDYTVGGKQYEVLTSEQVNEAGGSFVYSNAANLDEDDILCIYVGVNPTERDPKNGTELLDPAVYVKVKSINGNKVTFEGLDEDSQMGLYKMPDNFPIIVASLPTGNTGTVNLSALDRSLYATMTGDERAYEKALESVSVGDFVTLYISMGAITSENDLYYGEITAYNQSTKEITYKQTTKKAIEESMDLYSELSLAGEDLVSEEEKNILEGILQKQVEQSGFAEEAAEILCDMATRTDGFKNNIGVKNFLLTDENGNELTDDQIKLLNLGKSFELTDDIKLSVQLITSGNKLHYDKGVQLSIGVEAGFEIEVEEGSIVIELSADFVQEVMISPRIQGGIVTKEILFIPIPIGVSINSTIDIKSFTAFSLSANIYTVEEEDESLWDKFKNITEDPTEALGLANLPEGLTKGLSSVGDVMGKIEELKEKIDKANEDLQTLKGYKEDVEALWKVVADSTNGKTTKESVEAMWDTFNKTNVAADLLGLMDSSDNETEFLREMQDLMDKYSEMLEKETDWVTLVDKEIFKAEVCIFGVAIGTEARFVVRVDMNIAIGCNLEYEVGKRYNFWFKIGLFKPQAGSSTMDLIDEHFAFQFYVMGKIGLKAGIRAKFYVGIGSGKFASVGIAAELGPYIKLYGFFVYDYSKYRPVGKTDWVSKERMAGALYLDFGLYFMMGFEANALGNLFEYSYDFIDVEIPLLKAGEKRYYYATNYELEEDEKFIVTDEDGNSSNGITEDVPKNFFALSFIDLDTGVQGFESLDLSKYSITFSNRNFSIDKNTGKISVNVPNNTRYMECDMTITYLYGKVAFSTYDMSITIPLVWTNLSGAELNEYYTASVRVGNDIDGYTTVWSKKLIKNKEFDLPTEDEVKKLIGFNDLKHTVTGGYGGIATSGLTLIDNRVYDYKIGYKTYSVTVDGIENADGTKRSDTFTARFGEAFDFSALQKSGTSSAGIYNKFAGVTTTATVLVNGKEEQIDLTQPINGKLAEALKAGVHAKANYVDDSVTATFVFNGIEHDNETVKIKRGTVPEFDYSFIVEAAGSDVVDISPKVGAITSATTYYVTCRNIIKKLVNISFNSNGGSMVDTLAKKEGTVLPVLATPTKTGYTFDAWYSDSALTNKFTDTFAPSEDITLYAKWNANRYTVSFNVNGGNNLSENEQTRTVTYDETYGTLPAPTKTGFGFIGWFTQATGGDKLNATDKVKITANKTFYAHWVELKEIPESVFDFGETEVFTYTTGTTRKAEYVFNPGVGESYSINDFTFSYKIQGESDYISGLPVHGGTYDILVKRDADNTYLKFEKLYTGVLTINYITFDVNASWYLIEIKERSGTGSSYDLVTNLYWSNGDVDRASMPIDKDWNARYYTKFGARPTRVTVEKDGNVSRTMHFEVYCYDILGNKKTMYTDEDYIVRNYWKDKDLNGMLPNINTSAEGINVDDCSKIAVNLSTYGVNSNELTGLTYIIDNPAVTVNGNRLLIDGSLLTSADNTITVKVRYPDGTLYTIASFNVVKNITD